MSTQEKSRRVIVTGAAGFVGFHLAARLLDEGVPVLGIDNLNPYYDPALKRARLARLEAHRESIVELTPETDAAAAAELSIGLAEQQLKKAGYRVARYDSGATLSVSAERGYLRETGNLVFHTAPHQHDHEFHWHAHLWPKLVTVAGFEQGTGVMINISPPEDAALELRSVARVPAN